MADTMIEELTEETEAERVDAVAGPATGIQFLLLKAESPEGVTELEAAQIAAHRAGEKMFKQQRHNPSGQFSGETEGERLISRDVTARTTAKPSGHLVGQVHTAAGGATHAESARRSTSSGRVDTDPEHDRIMEAGAGLEAPEEAGAAGREASELQGVVTKAAHELIGQASTFEELAQAWVEFQYATWEKAKYSAEDKRKLMSQGKAIANESGDPSYPIADEEDLHKAIKAVGRGGGSHDRIRRYIIRRAKAMGKSDAIPENWTSGGTKGKVSKAMGDVYLAMDPENYLDDVAQAQGTAEPTAATPHAPAAPAPSGGGAPGSPEWEGADAGLLTIAAEKLAIVCNLLCEAKQREYNEVMVGLSADQADVDALCEAKCAVDCALGIVASLAFKEGAEGYQLTKDSLTETDVEVLRRALSLLESGELTDTYRQPEEVWDLGTLTKEDLADVVGGAVKEGISQGLSAAFAKMSETEAQPEEEAPPNPPGSAPPEQPPVVPSPPAQPPAEEPATEEAKSEFAMLKESLDGYFSGIDERLAAIEGQPQAGGPMVGPRGAGFRPGQPPRGTPDTGVPREISDLRSQIQKAEADGNTILETRLREELGREVLSRAWAGQGYPATQSRVRAMQFTENAAR